MSFIPPRQSSPCLPLFVLGLAGLALLCCRLGSVRGAGLSASSRAVRLPGLQRAGRGGDPRFGHIHPPGRFLPFCGVPLPPAQANIVTRINPQATRAGGASAVVEWLLHAPPGAFAGGEWKIPTLGPRVAEPMDWQTC